MPIYDYECRKHGFFKELKTIQDREKAVCPICGERSTQVIICPPSISIKNTFGDIKVSQAHEQNIRNRYVRPDGTVGQRGDKYFDATIKSG